MLQLPPNYLQSVVALGIWTYSDGSEGSGMSMTQTATGFLYAYPPPKDKSGILLPYPENKDSGYERLWLVTCKHVVQTHNESSSTDITIRMNYSGDEGRQNFGIPEEDYNRWTFHPNADVAVINTSWTKLQNTGIKWSTFVSELNSLNKSRVMFLSFTEGDEVFVIGFPVGWREGRQDYPVVRHGMLAQVQGWFNGDHDTFLVDGSGFPGSSGGPVVTKPTSKPLPHGQNILQAPCLIGMVSERRFSRAPVLIGGQEDETGIIQVGETANLIEVIPIDLIDETISLAMKNEGTGN